MALMETTGFAPPAHHRDRHRVFVCLYQDVLGFDFAAESPGDVEDPEVRADPTQLDGGLVFQINGILFGLRPAAEASALRLEPGPPDPRLPATSGTD
jgi:hypothetical protein